MMKLMKVAMQSRKFSEDDEHQTLLHSFDRSFASGTFKAKPNTRNVTKTMPVVIVLVLAISAVFLLSNTNTSTQSPSTAVNSHTPWCSEIKLSNAFGSNMVIQHGSESFVYGTSTESKGALRATTRYVVLQLLNDATKVVFESRSAVAADGAWKVSLGVQDKTEMGSSFEMRVWCASLSNEINKELFDQQEKSKLSKTVATITNIVFGDVYFCAGQSNMELKLSHTFSKDSVESQLSSETSLARRRIRLLRYPGYYYADSPNFIDVQHIETKWVTVKESLFDKPNHIMKFSATCLNTAMAVINGLGEQAPYIGLIQSAVGGTQIEEWVPEKYLKKCKSISPGRQHSRLYNGMVAPFTNMTVATWLWYQGENNVFGPSGNSAQQSGYGCEISELVQSWRDSWKQQKTLFGLVELAAGTDEGHLLQMSSFQWSQTANYGHAPNHALPNVFVARGYDLGDPWPTDACYLRTGCCAIPKFRLRNLVSSLRLSESRMSLEQSCLTNKSWKWEEWYQSEVKPLMGPVHPRNKIQIGERLAVGLLALQYKVPGTAYAGPTISGCVAHDNTDGGFQIRIEFNKTLLSGDSVAYDLNEQLEAPNVVGLGVVGVCIASTEEDERNCQCMEWRQWKLADGSATGWSCVMYTDGMANFQEELHNRHSFEGTSEKTASWIAQREAQLWGQTNNDVIRRLWRKGKILEVSNHGIVVGVENVNVGERIRSIRYGWALDTTEGSCCTTELVKQGWAPCPPASCPIKSKASGLPAAPFFAEIDTKGQCKCPAPQECSSSV